MSRRILYTSESVTEGHPDKVADQVSDAILDALLEQDSLSRVAVETLVTTGLAVVSGEITTKAVVNYTDIIRNTITGIGYTNSSWGIDGRNCGVLIAIDPQSPDIAQGVDTGGAGDQGMMFGFAVNETEELMPAPIAFAHRLTHQLAKQRKEGALKWLRPDGKSQVTVEYAPDGTIKRIDTIVISTQHDEEISQAEIKKQVIDHVIRPVLPEHLLDDKTIYHVNPTGKFVIGGPQGDTGLTGRKIIVDTYGGMGRHGGGAFSGKDPSKVDRSAAYAARWVAKNVVAAGLARRAEIQVAYAIGVAEPVSIYIDTFGTGTISEEKIEALVRKHFDLTPRGIMTALNLRRPMYKRSAAYGHFGRLGEGFPWEETNLADTLRAEAK